MNHNFHSAQIMKVPPMEEDRKAQILCVVAWNNKHMMKLKRKRDTADKEQHSGEGPSSLLLPSTSYLYLCSVYLTH
ncbi:hypothetical protein FOMPIDRAFT_1056760 [Fomitopsis schrenkii]|uniref:Uncharacterized protein n=1 Tax=Fomitopsis schrenkii TaxID=2126942 RepID=S8F0K2_FOMSC|nr:hypothetical protein FOMPIDRAFT_1056760 [Fomitopsis schrenkii]